MNSSEVERFGLCVWSNKSLIDHRRPHRHNEIELNYIERGAVTYIYAGHAVHIHAGENAVFWGAVPHQLTHHEAGTLMDIATVPLEDVLLWDLPQSFLTALLSGTFFCASNLPYDESLYRQWGIDVEAGEPQVALLEIKAFLHRCARTNGSKSQHAAADPGKAQQMARYMSRHFQQSLAISDIAASVGLHPHYAMAVFKAVFGTTMIDYLTQQRVAYVQQHLLTTDRSVTDIAYDAGFQTISHFYEVFKRFCGTSPGKYRAALRR